MKAMRILMALVMLFSLTAAVQAANVELHVALEADSQGEIDVLTQLIKEFEAQNPGVTVTMENPSWNPLKEKLVLTMAGGAAPDVFTLGDGWEVEFAPMLLPLDSYVNKWPDYKDYIPAVLEACKYKGMLYGLPYRANPWTAIYNGGYFLEAGLNPEKPPQTWDDVTMMAKKLVKTDGDGKITRSGAIHYGAQASTTYNAYTVRALLGQNGVDWADFFDRSKLGNVARSNPVREALDYYVSFERNGWSAWTGNWTQFAAGNTAILIAGQFSDIQGWRNAHPMLEDDARAALPLMKVRRAAPMPVDKWSIWKGTKNPDLAVKFLMFLSSRENLGRYLTSSGSIPARRSLGTLDYIRKDPEVAKFMGALDYGMPLPRSVFAEKVAGALGKAAGDMLYKKTPFEAAIEEMITSIQALGI